MVYELLFSFTNISVLKHLCLFSGFVKNEDIFVF
jgi:hypothetical protein